MEKAQVMNDIGVILTVYKRPQNLAEQLKAVRAQTIAPAKILVWHNNATGTDISKIAKDCTVIEATPNMGVWPRFLIGMELTTKYVCIFDDDTIPGNRWFENCLLTMKTHRGVLGTVGVTFKHSTRQGWTKGDGWSRVGWCNPNEKPVEVDIVGHSWFIERDWLRAYANEPRCGQPTCGEDYHLSVSAQKQLGLKTYAPAHPKDHKEWWGSIKGMELGTDQVALYRINGENDKRIATHAAYVEGGWQPLINRSANGL